MKKKKKRPSKAYIIDDYPGPKDIFDFFWNLTNRLKIIGSESEITKARKAYHHFLVHIYISNRLKTSKTDDLDKVVTSPIPSTLIRSKFKDLVDVDLLKKKKLIRFTKHSHGRGENRCREFRLHEKIYNEAIKITEGSTLLAWESLLENKRLRSKVNIITGNPKKSRMKNRSFLYTNSQKLYAINKLVIKSINSLLPCPVNPYALIPYFKNVKKAYWKEKKNMASVKKKLTKNFPNMTIKEKKQKFRYIQANGRLQKIQGLHSNIMLALETIMAQKPQPINTVVKGKQLWEYQAAYRAQKSGRVSEIHGGFQNITTPCKKLLLQDVPNVYNYDLKNSQAVLLYIELKACGIKCKWLKKYINDKTMRERLAKEVGISVGCWKSCFYSIVMGSPAGGISAVNDAITKETKTNKEAKKLLKKFKMVATPLISSCKKWRAHLFNSINPRYKYKHKGYHWKNACGMTFQEYITDYVDEETFLINKATGEVVSKDDKKTINAIKRQLPAFYLQGKEAFLIHTLTLMCKKHGIPVYKNEHDGLITGQEVPEKIWQQAAKKINANGVSLEIKDICSKSKWKAFHSLYK